jgi:hypothetical protein
MKYKALKPVFVGGCMRQAGTVFDFDKRLIGRHIQPVEEPKVERPKSPAKAPVVDGK